MGIAATITTGTTGTVMDLGDMLATLAFMEDMGAELRTLGGLSLQIPAQGAKRDALMQEFGIVTNDFLDADRAVRCGILPW